MKKLVLFDFDHTITKKDSFGVFLRESSSFSKRLLTSVRLFPWIIQYKLTRNGTELKKKVLFHLLKGRTEDELVEMGEKVAHSFLDENKLKSEVFSAFLSHIQKGNEVIVVSGGLDLYIQPWCEKHGAKFISTELEFIDGVATGKMKGENCIREEKKRRVEEEVDLSDYDEIICYGNPGDDDALFELGTEIHKIDR